MPNRENQLAVLIRQLSELTTRYRIALARHDGGEVVRLLDSMEQCRSEIKQVERQMREEDHP